MLSIVSTVIMVTVGLAQKNKNAAAQLVNRDSSKFHGLKNGNVTQQINDINSWLDDCNVSWNIPGPGSAESMPIGNGDIGLNVWVEKNGDLAFYISKTDAWGGEVKPDWDPWMKQGGVLMKLGLVHVSLSPNFLPPGASFQQVLKLHNGEIEVKEGDEAGAVKLRVWVDANNPVIRVEAKSSRPVSIKVKLDDWRIHDGDTVLTDQSNRIAWYHRNADTVDPHLVNLTFGAIIRGRGLVSKSDTILQSKDEVTYQLISIYPFTSTTSTVKQWMGQLNLQIVRIGKLDLEQTRTSHQHWWNQFWHRSWIFIHDSNQAVTNVTKGYVLQRFITACAGRGAYPIKFNGSIFVVDNPEWKTGRNATPLVMNADFRGWGGQYWFQNTRAMYWPLLMSGDFDEMLPLFRMYAKMLPANAAQVKKYYNHEGAYFAETSPFWGGLPYMGPEVEAKYTNHYFTPVLELSMMMFDYFEYTGDKKFLEETLLPVATAGLRFFDRHFRRDAEGKLLLDPDNATEMFWKVQNPAPDIAGLHAILSRMIGLPGGLLNAQERKGWKKMLEELPELPVGTKDGKKILLPYTGEQTAKSFNLENPELYSIYPFRLYGLGKPDLQIALNAFIIRRFKDKGCWVQDPIQAAMLGLTGVAKEYVTFNLTRKEPGLKFPAFWATGHDYTPDEDNGGNGENGLQQMLMQANGKKILMLAAWPEDWDADFKLHAPYHTTVQGKIVHGKLTKLVVIPAWRMADITDMSGRSVLPKQ